MRAPTSFFLRTTHHNTQSGVTLIVVLIMLVIIGLVSATAMRRASTADLITNNTRLENLAKQAAQAGLRYCENKVINLGSGIPEIPVHAAPVTATDKPTWQTFSHWQTSDAKYVKVPLQEVSSVDSSFKPSTLPQCMAEFSPTAAGIVVITARGFSPDYTAESDGTTRSGSVVWLQSIIALAN